MPFPTVSKDVLKKQDTSQLLTGGNFLHSIHLRNILDKFEERLDKGLSENDWQDFFKNNMLVLNPGYMKLIPKTSIAPVAADIPDFLLISIEGYVDVYEIKIPDTKLLNYDNDHDNYYWSTDISKAISQTENYISSLDSQRYTLEKKIEGKYQLKLTILRPRGYIIAGNSKQLDNTNKKDDFRLLNESLRNSRVVTYDTFLNNFKNLAVSLQERGASLE